MTYIDVVEAAQTLVAVPVAVPYDPVVERVARASAEKQHQVSDLAERIAGSCALCLSTGWRGSSPRRRQQLDRFNIYFRKGK